MNEQNHKDRPHVDQHILELLNGGVDGELSAAEQDDLDKLLTGSDEVCGLNEELIALTTLLDGLPEIEPPSYLQEAIEKQIRLPVQSNHQLEKQGFFSTWLPMNWLRTGIALAAGAVLTVGVYELGSGPITDQDAANMVGTVMKSPATDQGELLDSIQVSTDMMNGLVALRSNNDLFTLDVRLDSGGPTRVVVDFSGQGLKFEGITRKLDQEDELSLMDGSVNIASGGGQNYTLKFRRTSERYQDNPLELKFFARNTLVHEATLSVLQK